MKTYFEIKVPIDANGPKCGGKMHLDKKGLIIMAD